MKVRNTRAALLAATLVIAGSGAFVSPLPAQADVVDPEQLEVSAWTDVTYTRIWDWEILMTVDDEVHLFDGQSSEIFWTITVNKTNFVDDDHHVAGFITIRNPAAVPTTVTGITSIIDGYSFDVDCEERNVVPPFELAAGGSVMCTYSDYFVGETTTNTVTVTTSGDVAGTTTTVPVEVGEPTTTIRDTMEVWDTIGGSWSDLHSGDSVTSLEQVRCGATEFEADDEGTQNNTASMSYYIDEREPELSRSSASTDVNCWGLYVDSYHVSYNSGTRETTWDVEKTSDAPDDLILALGDVYPVTYTVDLTAETAWGVAGELTIENPAPESVLLEQVIGQLSDGTVVDVDCSQFDFRGMADCSFFAELPDGEDDTITFTATNQFGASYASEPVDLSFDAVPVTVLGTCIGIADNQFPNLTGLFDTDDDGQVCLGEEASRDYTLDLTAEECGPTLYTNTVSLSNGETSTVDISGDVRCDTDDPELVVTKSATTSYTRDWEWFINTRSSAHFTDLFDGQTGQITWNVEVGKQGPYDSDWAVEGDIVITNPADSAATVTGVTDSISGVGEIPTSCDAPFTVPAHGSVTCHYATDLPDADARINTATVTTSGSIAGGTAQAGINFGAPTIETNATVDVIDTNGNSWDDVDPGPSGGTKTLSYPVDFTCPDDAGQHNNTASIVGTALTSNDYADIQCHSLEVTSDSHTTADRTFEWDVSKTSDAPGDVTLALGQVHPVTFTVDLDTTSSLGNFAVAGNIQVRNPAFIGVTLTRVVDELSDDTQATVDCGVDFPFYLEPRTTLNCTYHAPADAPADGTNLTNKAVVSTVHGVSYGSDRVEVDFSDPAVTDRETCISIDDNQFPLIGNLFDTNHNGSICVGEEASREYTLDLPTAECGPALYENTVTLGNGETSTVSINTDIPCDPGCTLPIGYWKTHSIYGPDTHPDAGWYTVDFDNDGKLEGPDETFFSSGKTALGVFKAGNPYYTTARQYIGARLNIGNGASSTPAVTAAITAATAFFQTYGPDTRWSKTQKAQLTGFNTTLAAYNTGTTGPGPCDETSI